MEQPARRACARCSVPASTPLGERTGFDAWLDEGLQHVVRHLAERRVVYVNRAVGDGCDRRPVQLLVFLVGLDRLVPVAVDEQGAQHVTPVLDRLLGARVPLEGVEANRLPAQTQRVHGEPQLALDVAGCGRDPALASDHATPDDPVTGVRFLLTNADQYLRTSTRVPDDRDVGTNRDKAVEPSPIRYVVETTRS